MLPPPPALSPAPDHACYTTPNALNPLHAMKAGPSLAGYDRPVQAWPAQCPPTTTPRVTHYTPRGVGHTRIYPGCPGILRPALVTPFANSSATPWVRSSGPPPHRSAPTP